MPQPVESLSSKLGAPRVRHQARLAGWMSGGTLLLVGAAAACVWGADLQLAGGALGYRAQYLTVVALVLAWMMLLGWAFNRRAEGLLIDGRNRISLSRLQLFIWLVIVGCAFAVQAAHNFRIGDPDPSDIVVPLQIGLVMGAATTSFVAAPAILSLKARAKPSQNELRQAHRLARDGASLHPNSGRLYSRRAGEWARWSDLFRGEELENAGSADPAKVQQFLVTFMLATIYVAALWRDFAGPIAETPLKTLPGLSEGGLILLGVSHAAYLGAKAVPQTPAGADSGPTAEMPKVDTAPQPQPSTRSPPA